MSNYTLNEIGNRHSYRKLMGRNPDNSGNPMYAKRGKRSQRFAELPPKCKFQPKVKREEKPQYITRNALESLLNRKESLALLDAGYTILVGNMQTVRKVKNGAVARYLIKG